MRVYVLNLHVLCTLMLSQCVLKEPCNIRKCTLTVVIVT